MAARWSGMGWSKWVPLGEHRGHAAALARALDEVARGGELAQGQHAVVVLVCEIPYLLQHICTDPENLQRKGSTHFVAMDSCLKIS